MIKTIFGFCLDWRHEDKYGHIENAAAPNPTDFRNSRRFIFNFHLLTSLTSYIKENPYGQTQWL